MLNRSAAARRGRWQEVLGRLALAVAVWTMTASTAIAADPPPTESSPAATETIGVASDSRSDARMRQRIEQLYGEFDGLTGVTVDVRGGVVTLTGTVPTRAARERAVQLAGRVESVVGVEDRVTQSYALGSRLLQTQQRVGDLLQNMLAFLPLLITALVLMALFWWLSARLAAGAWISRRFVGNPFLRDAARQGVRVGVLAIGVLLALEILDATTMVGTVLGAAGVVGLAVGFAMRDAAENYVASLLLSLRQPFGHGEHVDIDGIEGRVLRLTERATILMTFDGNHTRIPNAKVYKAVIVNYTRHPKRRFAFDVGVDTEQDLASAQSLAATTVLNMDGVLSEPPPHCTVMALGESNVVLRVFGWVDQNAADFLQVRSEAIRLVKLAFDGADIVMPEPIYSVRLMPPGPDAVPEPPGVPAAEQAARAGHRSRAAVGDGPTQAIDIAPRDDLRGHLAAERDTQPEDILNPGARKE